MKIDINKERYNQIWRHSDILRPEIWSHWRIIKEIIGKKNLEIGPGNFPSIPIENGYFLDISETAVSNLKNVGAGVFLGSAEKLDFPNSFFDSAVAIDVLEHVENDKKALLEIHRVLKPGGFFLFSVPLKKEEFSDVDKFAGHKRRYEIHGLLDLLREYRFGIVKWRGPSLKYGYNKIGFIKKLLPRIYKSKKSFNFFGLPKFYVNFLAKLTALVDRSTSPPWQTDIENIEKFQGEAILVLCQK